MTVFGGHVGYHVVPSQRQRGHATRMLAEAVRILRQEGVERVLVTCDVENAASRGTIEHNDGRLLDEVDGTARYEIVSEAA